MISTSMARTRARHRAHEPAGRKQRGPPTGPPTADRKNGRRVSVIECAYISPIKESAARTMSPE